MNKQRYGPTATLVGFSLAGVISVLLMEVEVHVPYHALWVPFSQVGVSFGVCIAVCFYIFLRMRRPWRLLLFICACGVAIHASIFAADLTYTNLHAFDFLKNGKWGPGPDAIFVAGWAGAFIVVTAAFFLLSPEQKLSHILLKSICWSLMGAVLGVAGDWLDAAVGTQPFGNWWWRAFGNELLLYFVWQTGMASTLGLILLLEGRPSRLGPGDRQAGYGSSSLSLASRVFFGATLLAFVYFTAWEAYGRYRLGHP